MIIKHGLHPCLRNSRSAQRFVGFFFLIVLFGRWLAGQANPDRMANTHYNPPGVDSLCLLIHIHTNVKCEFVKRPVIHLWLVWFDGLEKRLQREQQENILQTVAHTSHSQTKGSLNCPHIILPKQGHPITWKKISVLVILHYNDYEILISESTSVGPRRQNTAFYQLKLIQI